MTRRNQRFVITTGIIVGAPLIVLLLLYLAIFGKFTPSNIANFYSSISRAQLESATPGAEQGRCAWVGNLPGRSIAA
jgi:hypothetical protein